MSSRAGRWWIVPLLFLLLSFRTDEGSAETAGISVVQGGVVMVAEPPSAPGRRIVFLGKTLEMQIFPRSGEGTLFRGVTAGSRLALVGVDFARKPGVYTLEVAETGQKISVRVVSRTFMISRLHVRSRYVSPPPSLLARIRRESREIHAVLGHRSPIGFFRPFLLPVNGRVTHDFGAVRILNGKPMSRHLGEDIDAPEGTPVRAANDGTVVLAGRFYYDGNMVIVDHGGRLLTEYLHMRDFSVKPGDKVVRGEIMGHVGHTGRVTGPVFHYGAVLDGQHVNPMLLAGRGWVRLSLPGR